MKENNQESFLQRRKDFERSFVDPNEQDPVKAIFTVDINTTDLCNRTCVFCPRHDPKVYPNRNLNMTALGAEIIAKKLSDIDYKGIIAFSGFSENLLNPEIVEIVRQFSKHNPDAFLDCNTNGDPLNRKLVDDLLEAGLDCLNINLYDGPGQIDEFEKMLSGVEEGRYKYRLHWSEKDYGIIFNNRSGLIQWMDEYQGDMEELKTTKCYYPFYKLFVDWNGDILFCANDWGRTRVVGNLMQQSVRDVWMSKEMRKIRSRLANAKRNFSPCDNCSVQGTLMGEDSFNIIVRHYENSNNR